MNLLRGLLVSGGESLLLVTCCKYYIALFSLYEFFFGVSHIKFLMRQYQHKVMPYHPFFPTRVFGGRYCDIRCIVLFSLCEFHIYGFSYKVLNDALSTQRYMLYYLFFPTRVFGRWYLKHIDPMAKVFLD
jgi:hypothetical protein